jgi:hypothetical protein
MSHLTLYIMAHTTTLQQMQVYRPKSKPQATAIAAGTNASKSAAAAIGQRTVEITGQKKSNTKVCIV